MQGSCHNPQPASWEKERRTEYRWPILPTRRQTIDSQKHMSTHQCGAVAIDLHLRWLHVHIRSVGLVRRATWIFSSIAIEVITDRVLRGNERQ